MESEAPKVPPAPAANLPAPASGHTAADAVVCGERTEAEVRAEIKTVNETPPTKVKDERWIETRISELENELNDLRKLKRAAPAPPAVPANTKRSFLDEFFDWKD